MTKTVRIENADTSQPAIMVVPQHLNERGEWEDAPDVTRNYLPNPTDQVQAYVHSRRRLIIQESN